MRAKRRQRESTRGFALIALMGLITAGILIFLVTSLSPALLEAYRDRKTNEALAKAREALLGYASRYRDSIDPTSVYGYLPLPDLGYSTDHASDDNRNNNTGCQHEGCDAGSSVRPAGSVGANFTVIGRFPWHLMGTEPIRDGYGECLWYAVSGSHKRTQPNTPMNWDTPGQLDIVVANGGTTLASILASPHDRPVAILFSPGPPLAGQNRAPAANQVVDECGGNYDVANYLDPGTLGALSGVSNYFGGTTHNAAGNTSAATKALSIQGRVYLKNDGTLWPGGCPGGATCDIATNDLGVAITPDDLFDTLRKNANFRNDINDMLQKMTNCWSANIASLAPDAVSFPGPPPNDKLAGRLPVAPVSCTGQIATAYGDGHVPIGYFSHYRDMIFVARPNDPVAGRFNVNGDSTCTGVLIFAAQRGAKAPASPDPLESPTQLRTPDAVSATNTVANRDWIRNYLEEDNFNSFTGTGSVFSGPSRFGPVKASKRIPADIARCMVGGVWQATPDCLTAEQDIVRCIPDPSSLTPRLVFSPALSAAQQLVDYDAESRTLTLGRENVTTRDGVAGQALFGCAWMPDTAVDHNGFRAYFQFRFRQVGTSVGDNGFVFVAADAESNGIQACGAAGAHLGYSGSNGVTPPLTFPKIGIEFDQGRNAGFSELPLNPGRNDPCGTTPGGPVAPVGCSPPYVGYNSHAAIVYWGHERANAFDRVTAPGADDNVHGFPTDGSQGANPRPAPRNPGDVNASPPGIAFVNLRGQAGQDVDGDGDRDGFLYHVRVELTPSRNHAASAEQGNTIVTTRVWIERDSDTTVQLRAALQNTTRAMAEIFPGYSPRLSDTATVYDVAGAACGAGNSCPQHQACGADNICYRQALRSIRLGFTGSQRTQDQRVDISNFYASWPE